MILIGIPCYGGQCYSDFMMSVINLIKAFDKNKIQYDLHIISNESLISRARNSIVAKFMDNFHYTHLLFLDSDLIFQPSTILKMIAQQKEIVGASYPKKTLNWEKIKHHLNEPKGKSIHEIQALSSDMNYNVIVNEKNQVQLQDGFFRVKDVPTGMMLIDKRAMCQIINKNRDSKYKNNVAGYVGENCFYDLFKVGVHNGIYLSEDYYFCQLARECGIELWLDGDSTLMHIGKYNYMGNLGLTLMNSEAEQFDADGRLLRSSLT